MKFRSTAMKFLTVLGILAILSITAVLWYGDSPDGKHSSGTGIFLAKPAFAQEDGVSFLAEEAGISAYMNAGQTVDLAKAKSAFRTVERETGEYVIGSVPLSGYAETEDVHAYVHKDGWIVTYYIKDEPAAKILDWNDYGTDEKINGTKLEIGIVAICTAASVATKDVKYYDFRYPDANRMMIVVEALWGDSYNNGDNGETFRVKLPSDFVFHERSFSHRGVSQYNSYMSLDDVTISETTGTNRGLLTPTQLSLDVFHDIKLWAWSPGYGAIVLIYRGT